MLNSVKMAHSRKVAVDKEKAEAKRKAEEAAAGEQAAKKRKEEEEAEQGTWDDKKLEDNIRENASLMAAVSRASRLKEYALCGCAGLLEDCQDSILIITQGWK